MAFENFDRLGKSPEEPYFGKGKVKNPHKETLGEKARNAGMFLVMLFVGVLYAPLNSFMHWRNRRRERKDQKP